MFTLNLDDGIYKKGDRNSLEEHSKVGPFSYVLDKNIYFYSHLNIII